MAARPTPNALVNVLLTLGLVALATTLVLPGRQTPSIIREGFSGLSNLTRASTGR